MQPLAALSDEELIARARTLDADAAQPLLAALYERHYAAVARWCWRICGDRDEAAELAQDVFLRVHTKLAAFRGESRFSTWLYQVTRSVAINRGLAANRRRTESLDEAGAPEPIDETLDVPETLARDEAAAELRRALREDLEPLEARVLCLHFVHGLTLAGITELLALPNKSGAKAYIVSAKRKLGRRFARAWTAPVVARGEPS